MGLQAPESKKGLQKLERNTSQTAHLFHAFTILGKQANFEMCTFLADYGPFSPYKRATELKIARCHKFCRKIPIPVAMT